MKFPDKQAEREHYSYVGIGSGPPHGLPADVDRDAYYFLSSSRFGYPSAGPRPEERVLALVREGKLRLDEIKHRSSLHRWVKAQIEADKSRLSEVPQ